MARSQGRTTAPPAVVLCFGLLALLPGCRSRSDLVEAELRTRDSQMRELRDEVFRLSTHNDALQHEVTNLRQEPCKVAPEMAAHTYTLKQVVLGRQTGGYDADGCAGDEALQVVLEPRDLDDHTIKAPGVVHVSALQISKEGLKAPCGSWEIFPDQLRRSWKSGLFSTGYYLVLPWKAWPASEKLRVVVQFQLADGRVFEADRDVTIHLPAERSRDALPGPPLQEEGPGPSLPDAQQARLNVTKVPIAAFLAIGRKPEQTQALKTAESPLTEAVHLLRPMPMR